MHMCECDDSIPPESAWQLGLVQHGNDALHECAIGTLSNSVLMRLIAHSVLPCNPMLFKVLAKRSTHVLSALVIAQSTDFLACLILSKGLELFEGRESLAFGLQQYNRAESGCIVDEGDPVAIA